MRDRHWLPALKLAGLEHGRQHDLRHTFTTWRLQAGVPIDEVAALLGHSAAYVSERYRHLVPGYGHKALDALNEVAPVPRMSPAMDATFAPRTS